MKILFRRIHLYAALLAGLVVTVTCLTGAVLVFEEELQHLFHHERYFVNGADRHALQPQSVIDAVQKAEPALEVSAVKVFGNPARTAEVSVADKRAKAARKPQTQKGEGGKKAYVDPYTGKVVEVYEYRKSGFYTVFALHRWMLGGDTGKFIVGTSTLIFLLILSTGIILWWPRNKAILKQRLRIKGSAGWKRLNHDYHIVFGFYSALFLFVFAFTGLAWSFEWFNKGIYTLTNSSPRPPVPPHSILPADTALRSSVGMDAALASLKVMEPAACWYNVSLPKGDSSAISIAVLPASALYEAQTTTYYFDQYSGRLLQRMRFADRNTGQRVRATFKPIHTGAIGGWPTRIIALLACLLGTFFPLTGYIMWINRTFKRFGKRKPLPEKI